MNRQLDYAREQLMIVVYILASSTLPLKKRLYDAVASRLNRIFITEHTKTNNLEIDQAIMDLQNKFTGNGLMSYEDAIDQMEDTQIVDIIEQIVGLFNKVCRAL